MRTDDVRRDGKSALLALACAAALGGACGKSAPPGSDPGAPCAGRNVVLVVIDTLRADRLPLLGGDAERAPFLAELAERSVVFENAWSTSSWTAPATASIFTGLYPDRHGVRTGLYLYRSAVQRGEAMKLARIPGDVRTLPELCAELGYRTFGLADNPNVCEGLGFARGFERFHDAGYEGGEALNDVLRAWGADLADAEPWFLYLHYMDPHAPYHERAPWYREPKDGAGELAADLAAYDSEIGYVDERLREAFELLGAAADRALVVVTADHGEEFGDHGGREHTPRLYGELTRVPLLVHLPGATRDSARRVSTSVSLVDLAPTVAGLIGAPPPLRSDGIDLSPVLSGEVPEPPERPLYQERLRLVPDRELARWAVVDGKTKLIYNLPSGRIELYDLGRDRRERRNVAERRVGERTRLFDLLTAFRERPIDVEPAFVRPGAEIPADAELLERLGYVGDE